LYSGKRRKQTARRACGDEKPAWAFFNAYWFGAIAFQVADPVLICAFIDNEFHIHIKEGE